MSQTSIKSDPTKTYCTLRETFDLVGKKVCGSKWQGFEADCDPARADRCMDCRHFDLAKDSKIEKAICLKYTKLMGRKGKKVPKRAAACKYFEAR